MAVLSSAVSFTSLSDELEQQVKLHIPDLTSVTAGKLIQNTISDGKMVDNRSYRLVKDLSVVPPETLKLYVFGIVSCLYETLEIKKTVTITNNIPNSAEPKTIYPIGRLGSTCVPIIILDFTQAPPLVDQYRINIQHKDGLMQDRLNLFYVTEHYPQETAIECCILL